MANESAPHGSIAIGLVKETRSTCPYCGVGCGVIIVSEAGQITGVRGDPEHPANFGRLCTKGSTLHLTAAAPVTRQTRLLHPMRRDTRRGDPRRVSWDAALDFAAQEMARIISEHGPDAIGFYVSGQLLTEDYYAFNKLAKGLIGTNNIDTNSRLCMSSAVAGYKQTFGADAPPGCYQDIDHAGCIFIVGSNTAYAHPILFRRIEDAKAANPALKIVFCDPRRTDTAEIADLHLPIQPGTDVSLFNGMLHIMLWEGWIDNAYIAAHTSGFDALKATVRDYTPDLVAETCGIDKEDLVTAARLFATSAATLSLYCQGLNQSSSGTAKNAALINLHLATGHIGRPGAAPLSLTGQPNAMGGREVGGMANLLGGHRDLDNPAHRAEVARLWGLDRSGRSIPQQRGRTAVEMFQAAADGEIRALWIACTNPAQSMPDQATVRRALERAELVIVQEAFSTTATCDYADLLLPATTWGEKTGTVTNSERRISRVLPAVPAPGEARHDWVIAVDLARRLEGLLSVQARADDVQSVPDDAPSPARHGRPLKSLFPYPLQVAAEGAEAIWNEHRESTRGRDLDITGMSYAMLEQAPQQWPLVAGESSGKARLYEDGVFPTADGRARFVNTAYRPVAEKRDSRFPFSLNTGRLRDQWHGMSRTGTLGRSFGHVAEPAIQMNAQDMARRRLKDGDLVQVTSRRGSILVPLRASAEIGMSQAFIAMHWGEEYLSGRGVGGVGGVGGVPLAGVNALTTPAYCPASLQPELKHAAVRIVKAELPWSLLAMAWLPEDEALTASRQLRPLMGQFSYASCVPFSNNRPLADCAGDRTGILFRAACKEAPPPATLALMERILGLAGGDTIRYADPRKGQHRTVRLVRHEEKAELAGFLLAGDTSAQSWIRTLLQEELPAQAYGRFLLLPGARPPVAVQSRGHVVCSCFNVTDAAIDGQLARAGEGAARSDFLRSDQERLEGLKAALRCGTNCGSCMPELQRRVRASGAGLPGPDSPPVRELTPVQEIPPDRGSGAIPQTIEPWE